jgi:hypothetical protein
MPSWSRPLSWSRSVLYAVLALPLSLVGMLLTLVGLLMGGVLSVTAVGPWLIALSVRGALALGTLQRSLAHSLLDVDIEPPPRRDEPGVFGWRRAVLGDRAGWRAVGCALASPLTAVLPFAAVVADCVDVSCRDGELRLSVGDDGRGGAAVGAGSGLTGLLDRIRTVDGLLTCDSPPGGPTVVSVVLPYR